jgi:peptidase S46-like protein
MQEFKNMNTRTSLCHLTALLCGGMLIATTASCADEGMWTFDNPPLKQLQEKYHFTPTQQWLDHVRLSCVRFNDGGSGSFVSPHGLVLTNHHVARGQLQKNSTAEHDYIRDGFYAATPEQEMKSPDLEVNVLLSMENVTERVRAAVKTAKTDQEEFAARKAVLADIERESTEKTGLRSDIVTLYQGGEYWLYRYKKYTDVRIVFAPEQQIAFFGGDPDNFTYPRYDVDFALFRIYENGKPLENKDYLKWNSKGAGENELVFVPGHPGFTQRLDTVAQLEYERDYLEANLLKLLRHRIAATKAYSALGEEQSRQASTRLFGLENSLKAIDGRYTGLLDPNVMAKKKRDEEEFKSRVLSTPEGKRLYGGAWEAIAEAMKKASSTAKQNFFRSTDSQLASLGATIVDYVEEIKKPDAERLEGFHEAQLDSLRFNLFSPAPIYPGLEIARMTASLEQAVQELGPDDPFVKTILHGRSPNEVSTEIINGTKLADPQMRKKLVDGGESAVASSTDPMIVLQRNLDPIRRASIKWKEENVDSVLQQAGEKLGKARFAAYGKNTYPDATFTLRLSYGQVKGYPMNGTKAPYKTTLYGLYDRAQSFDFKGPFALPSRYVAGRDKLDLSTPVDFVSTNDIIGGNSGSPVINRDAEIVGLIFDGNIESLVGDFVYSEEANRAVSVHTGVINETLRKLYGAQRLADELMGAPSGR